MKKPKTGQLLYIASFLRQFDQPRNGLSDSERWAFSSVSKYLQHVAKHKQKCND